MRRPRVVASIWVYQEGFREEVTSRLDLDGCVGFGKAATGISGEAKGARTVWQAETSQAVCSLESKGQGEGSAPASSMACTTLGKHLPSLAPVSYTQKGFARYSLGVLSAWIFQWLLWPAFLPGTDSKGKVFPSSEGSHSSAGQLYSSLYSGRFSCRVASFWSKDANLLAQSQTDFPECVCVGNSRAYGEWLE